MSVQDIKPAAEAPKSGHWAMVPKGPDAANHPHPDAEAAAETAKSTMEALNNILTKRVAANNPKAVSESARPSGPQYIKYTPKAVSTQHNSGVDHRIVQMQEMPKDPLDPPKFRHQKHYRVMTEEPTPLMHSPPKKLTRDEQEKFSIPPCVSAWKNNKVWTSPAPASCWPLCLPLTTFPEFVVTFFFPTFKRQLLRYRIIVVPNLGTYLNCLLSQTLDVSIPLLSPVQDMREQSEREAVCNYHSSFSCCLDLKADA